MIKLINQKFIHKNTFTYIKSKYNVLFIKSFLSKQPLSIMHHSNVTLNNGVKNRSIKVDRLKRGVPPSKPEFSGS